MGWLVFDSSLQLPLRPFRIFARMAEQAGVRTFLRPETQGHLGVGNVIDLMRSGLKQKAVHDRWHVARNATAGFRASRMTRVEANLSDVLGMTLQTHLIRLVEKF